MNGRLKAFTLILSFCLMSCVHTQQIHLYIKKIHEYTRRMHDDDFKYANLNDTNFVKPQFQGDMGIIMSVSYRLKDSLPNGRYQIFVNDTLIQVLTFKNKQRNGKSIRYYEDGSYTISHYKNGKGFGIGKSTYANGRLRTRQFRSGEFTYVNSVYNEDGRLLYNEFIMNSTTVRREVYAPDGASFKVYETDYTLKKELGPTVHTEKLNSAKEYNYRKGKFNVTYKNNEIKTCTWTLTTQ